MLSILRCAITCLSDKTFDINNRTPLCFCLTLPEGSVVKRGVNGQTAKWFRQGGQRPSLLTKNRLAAHHAASQLAFKLLTTA